MRGDSYRLERISTLGHQLLHVIESRPIDRDALISGMETQWLVTTPLYNIGEQTNCLSQEFTDAHPDIPWVQVAGLRHRLVHNYEGTNWDMIASVVFDELESFIGQVDALLAHGAGE